MPEDKHKQIRVKGLSKVERQAFPKYLFTMLAPKGKEAVHVNAGQPLVTL